jgi:hypothetical protein
LLPLHPLLGQELSLYHGLPRVHGLAYCCAGLPWLACVARLLALQLLLVLLVKNSRLLLLLFSLLLFQKVLD